MAVLQRDKSTIYGLNTDLAQLQQADALEAQNRVKDVNDIKTSIDSLTTGTQQKIDQVQANVDLLSTNVNKRIDDVNTALTDADTTIKNSITALDTKTTAADEALDGRLDIVEGGVSVVGSIAKAEFDAKAYADNIVDALKNGRVTALEDIVAIIDGDSSVDGSFRKAIADLVGLAPEALNTLQEIAQSIANDPNLDSTLRTLITTTITSAKAEIRGEVSDKFDTLKEVEDALNILNNPDETVDGSLAKILKDSKDWAINEINKSSTDLNNKLTTEATTRQTNDEALQANVDNVSKSILGTGTGSSFVGYAADNTNYLGTAVSLKEADKALDSAIKALDNDTFSKAETTEAIRVGGTKFATEFITVIDNKITLQNAPKDGMILNFSTVRHTDELDRSFDIPVLVTSNASGLEFQLYPNTTGQFDNKVVVVQYPFTPVA